MNIQRCHNMYIAMLNMIQLFEDTYLNNDSKDKLDNYFNEEQKTSMFFFGLNEFCRKFVVKNDICHYQFKCGGPLRDFVGNFIGFLSKVEIKDECQINIDDYYTKIINNATNYIESMRGLDGINRIRRILNFSKEDINKHVVYEEYSLSKIPTIIQNTKDLFLATTKIAKISLLSNDYFNIEAINKIRKRVLKCEYFEDKFKIVENTPNDFSSIFMSDYTIIKFLVDLITHDFKQIFSKRHISNDAVDLCLLVIYGKIILNMYIYLYQYKEIVYAKNLMMDDDWRIENNETRMTIELSKIYNGLDYFLYQLCYHNMSTEELITLIMIKFCDEVCIREESSIQYDRINRCHSLKSSFLKQCSAAKKNDPIKEKYIKIFKKIWDKGCKNTNAEILRQLEEIPEYAEEIKSKKRIISDAVRDFCKNEKDKHGNRKYPYAQGIDFHGRQNKYKEDIRKYL